MRNPDSGGTSKIPGGVRDNSPFEIGLLTLDINVYIQDKENIGSLCTEIKALFNVMI